LFNELFNEVVVVVEVVGGAPWLSHSKNSNKHNALITIKK
tara:strand:+ start:303 stop:422 length:120 start_codon:yes stop_codon:yes gene_type:complete